MIGVPEKWSQTVVDFIVVEYYMVTPTLDLAQLVVTVFETLIFTAFTW